LNVIRCVNVVSLLDIDTHSGNTLSIRRSVLVSELVIIQSVVI